LNKEEREKIDSLINDSYSKLIEIFNYQEKTPNHDAVYRTMYIVKGDLTSYFRYYIIYYMGVFEGILISEFLDKFGSDPTEKQKIYIQDSFEKRFHNFADTAKDYAEKNYKKDQ